MAPPLPPLPMPAMMAGNLPHEMDGNCRKNSERMSQADNEVVDLREKVKGFDKEIKASIKGINETKSEKEDAEKKRTEALKDEGVMELHSMKKESEKLKPELAMIRRVHMAKLKEEEEISKSIMECEKCLSILYQKERRAAQFKNESGRELQKEIHDLERALLSNRKEKSFLQEEIQGLKDEINSWKYNMKSWKSESSKLESALANKQKDHNDFMKQKNALQDEKKSFWKEENSVTAEINELGDLVKARKSLDYAMPGVDTIRRAVDKGKTNSSMALMGTSRPDHCSFQDSSYYIDSESGRELLLLRQHDDVPDDFSARVQRIRGIGLSTHEEFSGQDPQNQQSDADLNNIPCLPLDKKRTIKAMQIISVSALTMIGALSTYSADTLALALFPWSLTKEVFVTSPYVCITVGSIGVVLSFCASENDALAEYAAIAILLVCLSGIGLGALAVIVILHAAHYGTVLWILIWTYVIMITLIGGWGWLFAYPTCLKFKMRMMYWICFDRRRSTSPWSEAYADPRSTQHTDQKGFGRMLSTFVAACGRAFHPLDEDATIEVMKTFSPTILTPMSVLSLWVAHTIAPRAHMARTLQQFLYASPYVYLPLGVVTIALSVSASRSNGLANCASWLGLSLCTFGVILGAWCSIFLLHTRPLLTGIVSDVVIIAMFGAWGWMLAYPKRLRFVMRLIVFACCAPRGCVCSFWAWIFLWLKVFGLSVVQFVPRCFGFFRAPRGWWTAGRASSARGELDIEAGTNAVELTCLAGSCSPEEG